MKQQPENSLEARKEARRRLRRRRQIIRLFIVLAVVLLLVLVGTLVVLHIIGNQAAKKGETTNFLGVKAIQVEGETRYSDEEIIRQSGLYVGQSLLAVNKVQAHNALLNALPYLCRVEVGNASFDTLRIVVEETPVMGVVELEEDWMIVGENNHALERVTAEELPAELLRIVGAVCEEEQLGRPLLDERSLRICRTLRGAAERYKLDVLATVNVTEKTNIFLVLDSGMEVLLGNETNLEEQVETLVNTLPTLLANNGKNAAGRLDMTAYSDDDPANDRSIYTPQELLDKQQADKNAATTDKEPEESGTTSAE